jgi:tellurite resistance protein
VGFIAYSKLNGDLDNFGRVLYYTGLFFTLLMMSQIRRFTKLDFYLSWWAYSFPLAAITIATFLMHDLTGERFLIFLAQVLLAIVSVVITWLAVKTLFAIRRRGVCLPTH